MMAASIGLEPLDLGVMLARRSRAHPRKPAILSAGTSVSYETLNNDVNRFANALLGLGAEPGERILCSLPKTQEFVVAFLGSIVARTVYVPIDPNANLRTLRSLIEQVEPRWAVIQVDHVDLLRTVTRDLGFEQEMRMLVVGGKEFRCAGLYSYERLLGDAKWTCPGNTERCVDDVAYLNVTSGSTGLPKAAITSHRNLYYGLRIALSALPLNHTDIHLCCFPSYLHPHETIARPLALGGSIFLADATPREVCQCLAQYPISAVMANPSFYALMLEEFCNTSQRPMNLRIAESGGSPSTQVMLDEYLERFGARMIPVWGSTETTGICLSFSGQPSSYKDGMIGKPCPLCHIETDAEDDEVASRDAIAEMLIASPSVVAGYFQARGQLCPVEQRRGMLATGDLVSRDATGDFVFYGRRLDMIKTHGLKVYPREVEEVLLAHPQVADAVVFGRTDQRRGQRVSALVVPKDTTLRVRDLRTHCMSHLDRHKVPVEMSFVRAIPRGPSGKIDRMTLE